MKEKNTCHTIGIYPAEGTALPLSHKYHAQQQAQVNEHEQGGAPKAKVFTYCSKNKIGILGRDKIALRLGTF